MRNLRAELARLKAQAERRDAPTFDEYWVAARRETARRLQGVYERLARVGNGSPTPHSGPDRDLLADDTPEQMEADRRTVGGWERAHGTPDIKGAADMARARLLTSMRRE